ncbi:MAG: hypothetical protein AABX33_03150 [Nanoarchaeota archaeon]
MNEYKTIYQLVILLLFVNTVSAITDSNPSNNIMNISINVVETKSFNLFFIPVNTINNFDTVVDRNFNFLNNTFPISDDGISMFKEVSTIVAPENLSTDGELAEGELDDIRIKILGKVFLEKQKVTNAIGIVKENYLVPINATGINFNSKGADVILVDESQLKTTAHEVGHTFGLCDEYSQSKWIGQNRTREGGCPNGDLNGDLKLDSVCSNNGDGCPAETLAKLYSDYGNINDSVQLRNMMGDSDQPNYSKTPPSNFETWISNNTYTALFNRTNVNSDFTIPQISYRADISTYIIARIKILINGIVNILNVYELEDGFVHNTTSFKGNYTLEILNSSGGVISNVSFDPEFSISIEGGEDRNTNSTFVIFALPLSNQTLSRILVKNLTTTVTERNRSVNTPTLNLTFPLGNEIISNKMNITYNSSDLDNDTIQYAILISSDNGNTYSTLEIDYPNKSLTINSTNFINSNQYKIKILATDGINTGNDTSDTFSIYHDQNKFTIKNNTGGNIAWFGDQGNIVIKGTLEQNSNYQATNNFAFKIRNNLSDVLIIENNGSMYIDGTLFENQATIPIDMNKNEFRFKWNGEFKTNINESGYLFTKGTLTQNGNP